MQKVYDTGLILYKNALEIKIFLFDKFFKYIKILCELQLIKVTEHSIFNLIHLLQFSIIKNFLKI